MQRNHTFSDIDTRAGLQAYLGNTTSFSERDLYSTFGWIEDPDENDYYATYLRNPVAKAVVDKPAETTWREYPTVQDTDDETTTDFEAGVEQLQQRHQVWSYANRVDRLAGIGEYGIMVVGFADGRDLDQPVDTGQLSDPSDIAWFRVFPQISVTDIDFETDQTSPRWGMPVEYDVDLSDADDAEDGGAFGSVTVHHERVIHVPSTELLDDEVRGTPRQEPVFNPLNDIEKVVGSVSELAYRGADYGLHIDVDPEYDFDPDDLNEELQRYVHQVQNFIKTQGASVETLGGEIADPSGIVDTLMSLIAAQTGIPKRMLMGSEQGELASSQDVANYYGRISERQTQYAEQHIVRSLIDRLRDFGMLPEPENGLYDVQWPNLFELNELEEADVKNTRAQTLKNMAPQGNTDLVATAEKRVEFIESGDASVLAPDDAGEEMPAMPAPGEETPEQQEAYNEFFLNEWNPELHPRGPDGKFVESPGVGGGGGLENLRSAYTSITKTIQVGGESVEAAPVLRDAFSSKTTQLKQAALDALDESFVESSSYGPDVHGAKREFSAWRDEQDGSLLNDNTAELWGAAIDDTGNDRIPEDATATPNTVGDPLPAVEGGEPVTAIGDSVQVTRETLRKIFGDTVPVTRGVHGDFADQLREAKENGESVELEHRALESWTTFPDHAQQFANEGDGDGVFITTEIPVERIYGASHTTPGLTEEENEIVAALDSTVEYSPEQITVATNEGMEEVYKKMRQSASS